MNKKTILILLSNPKGTAQLDLLGEIYELKKALISLGENKFDVQWEPNVKQEDWLNHISRVKPQIIHFCGHGTRAGLIIGDENHQVLSNEYLANLLKEFADRVECVLLNACDTEPLAEALAKHINYAIGMNLPVKDRSAIDFAKYFYKQLGIGNSIEKSFYLARNEVFRIALPSTYQSESNVSSNSQDRKLTFVGEDDNLSNNQNQEHLIPVIRINPNPTAIKSIWLSLDEEKEAISQLLTAIDDSYNQIKLFHSSEPIILQGQYIPIQVTLERRYKDKLETIGSYTESEEELKKAYALKGIGEEEIKRQQEDWQTAKQKESRIIVLADPGMGKSTLLRMEVCQAVQISQQDLAAGKAIDSLIIPLFVRLSTLADLCANDNENGNITISEAVLKIIQDRHEKLLKKSNNAEKTTAFLNIFLDAQLKNGKCLLLFDALDEVPPGKRPKLLEKLSNFVKNYPNCRIIATSRIVGYGGKSINSGKEMEIVPFTQQQTDRYIKTWFANSVTHQGLIKALKDRPQLSGLAQNPLLLSLMCSLYQQDKQALPSRRGEIYEQAVNYMLKDWAVDNDRQGANEAEIDSKKELLSELAYEFSKKGTEVFSLQTLKSKIKDYLRRDNAINLESETNRLVTELSEKDGILQKINPDKSEYLFLHRTFQEYFTALYLKYKIEDDEETGIELVTQYLWNYDWHETIILLAGLLDEPMVLVEAISREKDDIFNTQLLLAGRCLGECDKQPDPLVGEIINSIVNFWQKYGNIKFVQSVIVEIGRTYDKVIEALLETINNHHNDDVKVDAVRVLGNIGNEKALKALILALNRDNYYDVKDVRRAAIQELGKIENDKAVDALISVFSRLSDSHKGSAIIELGKRDNDKAVDILKGEIEKTHNEYCDNRHYEIKALEQIGSDKAVDVLIETLQKCVDASDKFNIAEALGTIRNPKAVDVLLNILVAPLVNEEEDYYPKGEAARALSKIGNDQAFNALVSALKDKDGGIRRMSAYSLADIGNDQSLNILISILEDEAISDTVVRVLGKFNNAEAVDALISLLSNKISKDRSTVARALANIGNRNSDNIIGDKIIHALMSVLNEDNNSVRYYAVSALADIDNEKAIQALLTALKDKSIIVDVKNSIAEALGEIGTVKAIDGVITALRDKEISLTASLARVLGKTHERKVVDVLIAALKDETVDCKDEVAKALGMIGDSTASDILISLLRDDNSSVRYNAALALGDMEIVNDEVINILISALNGKAENTRFHYDVIKTLGKIGKDEVVDNLISWLSENEYGYPNVAIEALATIGTDKATDAIISVLRDRSNLYNRTVYGTYPNFRGSVEEALVQIRNDKAINALIEALQFKEDTMIRWRAAEALALIGNDRGVDVLILMLDHGSSTITERAAQALKSLQIENESVIDALIELINRRDTSGMSERVEVLEEMYSSKSLERLLQFPKIDIYRPDIFLLTRKLAIKFSKESHPFIPVYPELLGKTRTED